VRTFHVSLRFEESHRLCSCAYETEQLPSFAGESDAPALPETTRLRNRVAELESVVRQLKVRHHASAPNAVSQTRIYRRTVAPQLVQRDHPALRSIRARPRPVRASLRLSQKTRPPALRTQRLTTARPSLRITTLPFMRLRPGTRHQIAGATFSCMVGVHRRDSDRVRCSLGQRPRRSSSASSTISPRAAIASRQRLPLPASSQSLRHGDQVTLSAGEDPLSVPRPPPLSNLSCQLWTRPPL
jgi:hypothetical protein